jgi:hypothetical protein
MSNAVTTTTPVKWPKEVQAFLDNPPLVGNELYEEYEAVFLSIASALKPVNFIVWQLVGCLTDLAWYIRRERILKNEIIKIHHKEIVSELLAGPFNNLMLGFSEEATRWERDEKARVEIDNRLIKLGHSPNSVLAQAYMRAADQINQSDKRAADYQTETVAILREANRYNEKLMRQIDQASSDVVDAEFSEAAE